MSISKISLKNHMLEQNITDLYHANSVLTSLTFINQGGLLSRGAVEEKGLPQTSQISDEKDKKLGIWFDIFLDSDDYHSRIKDINKYGPVCFVYKIDILDWANLPDIKITNRNPINWSSSVELNRYIKNVEEYKKGNIGQHITLVNTHEILPFNPYLKKIILDDPHGSTNDLFENAKIQLLKSLNEFGLSDLLEIRACSPSCKCKESYNRLKSEVLWYKFKTK